MTPFNALPLAIALAGCAATPVTAPPPAPRTAGELICDRLAFSVLQNAKALFATGRTVDQIQKDMVQWGKTTRDKNVHYMVALTNTVVEAIGDGALPGNPGEDVEFVNTLCINSIGVVNEN